MYFIILLSGDSILTEELLETGILTVYRGLLLLGVTHSLHASDDEGGLEVFQHCFRFLVRSRL